MLYCYMLFGSINYWLTCKNPTSIKQHIHESPRPYTEGTKKTFHSVAALSQPVQAAPLTTSAYADKRPEALQLQKMRQVMNRGASTSYSILRPQSKKPARHPSTTLEKGPVQRMVISAVPEVEELDPIILMDLAFHHNKVGGKFIQLSELESLQTNKKKKYSIKNREGIVIAGHGSPGNVEGKNAKDLAPSIQKIANYRNAAFIYLASCNAGTETAQEDQLREAGSNGSLVDVLHDILNEDTPEDKGRIPVYGASGYVITDPLAATGDHQTTVREGKIHLDFANTIQTILSNYFYPDLTQKKRVAQWSKVASKGKEIMNNKDAKTFYFVFIKFLSGDFHFKEEQTKILKVEIEKHAKSLKSRVTPFEKEIKQFQEKNGTNEKENLKDKRYQEVTSFINETNHIIDNIIPKLNKRVTELENKKAEPLVTTQGEKSLRGKNVNGEEESTSYDDLMARVKKPKPFKLNLF